MSIDFKAAHVFAVKHAEVCNRRDAILIQLATGQATLMAVTRREGADPMMSSESEQETEEELFRRRDGLITDLVAAEREYQHLNRRSRP